MNSCLYNGWVRHRRAGPTGHEFRYRIFMTYIDLKELPDLFSRFWLWSAERPALARFRRKDYFGAADKPLDAAIRDLVAKETGTRPTGPIRLLTHLRYFGYCFNPVSFYYCFDERDTHVETIVAEVTNTPWGERHAYVLPADSGTDQNGKLRFRFDKRFHVSPFLPMDMQYDWRFSPPHDRLLVHMENFRAGEKAFDATLVLERQEITGGALARTLLAFPFITAKVSLAIYWQALRLWLKKAPFHTHPDKLTAGQTR
jgi:uncharacterized protein